MKWTCLASEMESLTPNTKHVLNWMCRLLLAERKKKLNKIKENPISVSAIRLILDVYRHRKRRVEIQVNLKRLESHKRWEKWELCGCCCCGYFSLPVSFWKCNLLNSTWTSSVIAWWSEIVKRGKQIDKLTVISCHKRSEGKKWSESNTTTSAADTQKGDTERRKT